MKIGPVQIFSLPLVYISRFNFAFISGIIARYISYNDKIMKKLKTFKFKNFICFILLFIFLANYEYLYKVSIYGQIIHYLVLIPTIIFFSILYIKDSCMMVRIGDWSYGIYLIHATVMNLIFLLL